MPVTLGASSSLTHNEPFRRYRSLTEYVSNSGIVKGTTMFALLVLAAVVFLLVAAMGMHQTWYGRWYG